MRRFASGSPTSIEMPAFRSSADRIAISDDRQLLHDDCDRETPPLIVDTARGGLVDGVAAELTVAEDRSWPIAALLSISFRAARLDFRSRSRR